MLRRLRFDGRLLQRRDIAAFCAAALLGMLATSANGVGWLRVAGLPDAMRLADAWLTWFVGDLVGALLAGIPLMALSRHAAAQTFRGPEGTTNALLLLAVLACGGAAFSSWFMPGSAWLSPLLAAPFCLIALLGLRGGVLASSLGVLLLAMAAAIGTSRGLGPFARHDGQAGALGLWSYVAAQACTGLLICSLASELQSSRRQFAALMQHSHDGILLVDADGSLTQVNPAAIAMLGLQKTRLAGLGLSGLPDGNGALLAGLVDETAPFPALFAYVDRTQTYRFANAHFRQMLGVEPLALVGQTMRQFMGAQAYAELLPHIEGALGGERQHFERGGFGGNAQRHFMVEYVPHLPTGDEVEGFFIMLLDITDRHRAEQALARSEDRIRTITDSLPVLISHIDRDFRYTFANALYMDWFSLPGSPVGRTVAEVFGEAVFEGVRDRLVEAMAGHDVTFDLASVLRGEPGYLQVHYLPDRDDRGEVRGVYGLVTDRTAERVALERLAASERQLRAVTDNLPVLITYVDADERLRFMNGTFRDWLGVDTVRAVGRSLSEVIGVEHYVPRQAALRAALDGQRTEFEIVSSTRGGVRNLQTVYVPDVRDDGQVRGVFTLSTDVTALKAVEAMLSRLAWIDTLTSLPNRRKFDEVFEAAHARSVRQPCAIALLFVDVDHFKTINDTHGHGAGDLVLREFAARLRSVIRASDTAARLAGDEFVVVLEDLESVADACAVAEKLVRAARTPIEVESLSLHVSASMGVAFRPGGTEGADARVLMARADRALYQAKSEGRDRYCVAPALEGSDCSP